TRCLSDWSSDVCSSDLLLAQASVDEPLRERAQGLALSSGEAAVAQGLGISREQLGGRGQMPSESLLQMRDDRSGRGDGQLLAGEIGRASCREGAWSGGR